MKRKPVWAITGKQALNPTVVLSGHQESVKVAEHRSEERERSGSQIDGAEKFD